jgi:hypothetical protein
LLNTWEGRGLALAVYGQNKKNNPWSKGRTKIMAKPELKIWQRKKKCMYCYSHPESGAWRSQT